SSAVSRKTWRQQLHEHTRAVVQMHEHNTSSEATKAEAAAASVVSAAAAAAAAAPEKRAIPTAHRTAPAPRPGSNSEQARGGSTSPKEQHQRERGNDKMSPPTAAPQTPSAPSAMSASAVAGDDAPPELDALRPTSFSSPSKQLQHQQHQQQQQQQQPQQAARIPSRRRLPISLAPVGVRKGEANSSPLPSLSTAMSSTVTATATARAVPAGPDEKPSWPSNSGGEEEWHQQQQNPHQPHYARRFIESVRARNSTGSPAATPPGEAGASPTPARSPSDPAADVGMRPKVEVDPGSGSATPVGGGDSVAVPSSNHVGAAAADETTSAAFVAPTNVGNTRGEGGSYHRSRKAYIQNRSVSTGAEIPTSPRPASGAAGGGGVRVGEDGQQRRVVSRHARRFSSGGEFPNGTSAGLGVDRYGGDHGN
ncbi:unnamed protein product, partial [Scytosiphon promiscuus]